ncbi:hypothetical protein ACWGJ2_11665 [Streptomyces sp. NPDC054796]
MSTTTAQTEHPPIYEELVDELGDVPADVRAVAERVLQEAEEAVRWKANDGTLDSAAA